LREIGGSHPFAGYVFGGRGHSCSYVKLANIRRYSERPFVSCIRFSGRSVAARSEHPFISSICFPECRWVPGPDHITNPSANLTDDCTGSHVNLELAKVWIQDCSTGHDLCDTGFSQTPPVLPSRVICVKNLQTPYLFETQGMYSEYLALSYCWGHGKRLLTTKQTYPVFQTGLPTDGQMPLTFQDAFKVSRALGYQYIWIDALCIIQDDEQDVQKEMAKMGDIYQNSTVTIFAANGNTTDSGLFVARNGPANKPTTVSMTIDDNDCLRTQDFTFLRPEYHAINPLSTRGWVSKISDLFSDCMY
jgi:hypothetical protein